MSSDSDSVGYVDPKDYVKGLYRDECVLRRTISIYSDWSRMSGTGSQADL